MSSKKRVFSTNNDMNYNDYIKLKNGSEILKVAKYNDKNGVINRFINYNQFLTLSDAYYKNYDLDKCDIYSTRNLYNSNISYVLYNEHEISVDNNCKLENICDLEKQVLYPYGFYKSNKTPTKYFPYKLCLENWCQKKAKCFDYSDSIKCNICNDKNDCHKNDCHKNDCHKNDCHKNDCHKNDFIKKCKTGLCKNAKPLFI